MRSVIVVVVAALVFIASDARADINQVYNGHSTAFAWSSDTTVSVPVKIAGSPLDDTPGSGSYALPIELQYSLGPYSQVAGVASNSTSQFGGALQLSQISDESFSSSGFTFKNKQFDVYQATYYGFTVSATGLYELKFEVGAAFSQYRFPVSGYIYAGTDSFYNIWDVGSGSPQNSVARYSLSAGDAGTNANYPFNPLLVRESVTADSTKYVMLQAGKLYQTDVIGYSYIGGDGRYNGNVTMFNRLIVSAVPEPASLTLLGSALSVAGIGAYRRHRKSLSASGNARSS